jgi:hypothetical protein
LIFSSSSWPLWISCSSVSSTTNSIALATIPKFSRLNSSHNSLGNYVTRASLT